MALIIRRERRTNGSTNDKTAGIQSPGNSVLAVGTLATTEGNGTGKLQLRCLSLDLSLVFVSSPYEQSHGFQRKGNYNQQDKTVGK